MGRGFEPHQRHCVVVLEQASHINPSLVLVQPRKTRPCCMEDFLWDVKIQIKQTNQPSVRTKIMFNMSMCRSRGGWAGGPGPPENHKNIGFPSITGLDLLKITSYKASIQCWPLSAMPAKRHFNGISLVGG